MDGLVAVVDADDVILATGENKLDYLGQHYPNQDAVAGIKPYECSRISLVPIIGLEFYGDMNDHIKSRYPTLATPTIDGAPDGIRELSQMMQVHVLSARTPEETEFVREWMEQNGLLEYVASVSSAADPKYEGVKAATGSRKADIASYLGAGFFVDDDLRHMPQEPTEGLHCLLFGEGKREDVAPHITIAKNWDFVVGYAQTLVPLAEQ